MEGALGSVSTLSERLGLLGLHVMGIICRCPLRADGVHRNASFLIY